MIVIPMVGRSSRFFKAGYTIPKYELLVNGVSVFSLAVKSFERYFETDHFRFLIRSDYKARAFVENAVEKLGIRDYSIVVFEEETLGQADTVYQGLRDIGTSTPIYVFNIDTFRPGFVKPAWADSCDGYLEVFRHHGSHWSFVEPGHHNSVIRTTEKDRISDLCSDGLYYFKNKLDFDEIFLQAFNSNNTEKGEYYIAPLYNAMIARGQLIRYELVAINDVIFCGTPDEYNMLLAAPRDPNNK